MDTCGAREGYAGKKAASGQVTIQFGERDRLNALKGPEEMRKEQERIIQKRKSARLGPDQEKKDPGFYL